MLDSIDPSVLRLVEEAQADVQPIFEAIDKTALHTQSRVLKAFTDNRVAAMHMLPSTGYGYDDASRDTLDRVFASALQAEDALVRPQFASGTHTLSVMLFAIAKQGRSILFAADAPYDTIHDVIGMGEHPLPNSLAALGVSHFITPLKDGTIDLEQIEKDILAHKPSIVYIQRSRGYAWRNALTLDEIGSVADLAHRIDPKIIVAVDNCYGEFT